MSEGNDPGGGCNCGEIRYLLRRPPLTAYICHCHLCQKRTGSAFSMSLVVPAGAVEVVAGSPQRTDRALPAGGKHFSWSCGTCASRIWTQREGAPMLNLRAGTLDDTKDLRPVAQFWTSSAQAWAIVDHDILSYEEQPTDYAPMLAAWKTAATSAER